MSEPRSDSGNRITAGKSWFIYILECEDGSFYTGTTTDPARRLGQHRDGKASRYTRTRLPVKMIYQERCGSRSQALTREWEIKSLSRKEKERLIGSGRPSDPPSGIRARWGNP